MRRFGDTIDDLFGGRVKLIRTRETNDRARASRERERASETEKAARRERYGLKRSIV